MASRWDIPARSIWYLKSGPASTRIFSPPYSTNADDLSLLSIGSAERHTSHLQPIIGMPCDVPVPRNVSFALSIISLSDRLRLNDYISYLSDFLLVVWTFDPDIVACISEHLPVVVGTFKQDFLFDSLV